MKKPHILLLGTLCLALFSGPGNEEPQFKGVDANAPKPTTLKVDADYGRMPLYFIPNQGQMDKQVAYYVQGKDKTIYFTPGGITFALTEQPESSVALERPDRNKLISKISKVALKKEKAASSRWVVKLEFVGADKSVRPVGGSETGAVVSYFKGEPEEWHTGLQTYSKITYHELWPGIDLVYYGTVNRLKYEFIVHPGADPSKIHMAYRGADRTSIDGEGRLNVATPAGGFTDDVPVAYQEIGGRRLGIKLAYKMDGSSNQVDESAMAGRVALNGKVESELSSVAEGGETEELTKLDRAREALEIKSCSYGFEVGRYDSTLPLVLDPAILVYCGYIGGSGADWVQAIAVDELGNSYITGHTDSSGGTFPVKVGPDLTYNSNDDAFIAKVDASGTTLVFCGYIGGSSIDRGEGIALDGAGNAFVFGETQSTEATFPIRMGPDLTYNGGNRDTFVAKVNHSGNSLVYCGFIGGAQDDYGNGIAVDGVGNAYLTGETQSTEATFPVAVGPELTYNGTSDAFVAKVNAAGTALDYCGYIGGSGGDAGTGIAVDGVGNAYVAGITTSAEATFPAIVGPDLTYNGSGDAFVAKVNSLGTALDYCGFVGGYDFEACRGIDLDAAGNAYVTGDTASTEDTFPIKIGPDLTYNGSGDAFVAKVDAAGTALEYCGYIGGADRDAGYGIALDWAGNAYVTGETLSSEATFPVTMGPDLTYNGGGVTFGDAFMAAVNFSGKNLAYCGYIGGLSGDICKGIAVDGLRNAYVAGYTMSNQATFPVIVGPDLTYNTGTDAFVAKVSFFEDPVHKHAVGDFDGDNLDEFAIDFGAMGAWMWDGWVWSQISTNNPDNLIQIDIDGDEIDEVALDLGGLGLWFWNAGVMSLLNVSDPQYIIAADVNGNGIDEIIIDFGTQGLWWRQESGYMFRMTPMDPQNINAFDAYGDGRQEIVADFGAAGLWMCDAGNWSIMTGAEVNSIATAHIGTGTNESLIAGIGPLGMWIWDNGMWSQLSGVYMHQSVSGNLISGGEDEIVGSFGQYGLWLWNNNVWGQVSGANADNMVTADIDGDGQEELIVDFGPLGLWAWDSNTWSQPTGEYPESILSGDLDGDNIKELIVDFSSLGVWMWNEGTWSQLTGVNPD